MMTAERCAQVILRAAYRRQREVLMGPGRLIAWLKFLAPGLLDRILIGFLKRTVRRGQKNALAIVSLALSALVEEIGMPGTIAENLSGVAETLLIPLYYRAIEAQRPDAMIKDEKARGADRAVQLGGTYPLRL